MSGSNRDRGGSPSDLNPADRRRELLESAIAAVAHHGPEVTADQIANAAGISRPLLYRHFDNLAALQRAVAEHTGAAITQTLAESLDPTAEPDELVRAAATAFMTWIAANANLARYILQHFSGTSDVVDSVRGAAAGLLAEVMSHSVLPGATPAELDPLAHGIAGMAEGTAIHWLAHEDHDALPALTAGLARWALAAMLSEAAPGGVAAPEPAE